MEMYCVFIMFTVLLEIAAENLETKIFTYFDSATVQSFRDQWTKYQKPMENAISLALKEIYGQKGMNVYVRKMRDPHKINKGYYHSDNQVQILLKDLELDNLPHIWMPQVTFRLPSNILRVDASLSKMIVRCDYMIFRNSSSIIYDTKNQNYFKNSPFAFQQTDNVGRLGIIIEGCTLSGFTVSMLNGPSVNLGHGNFHIYNCHYNLEIYNPGSKTPPVFAPYNPEGRGLNIGDLLMTPLLEELMPKLQAAMFSYVNTTSLFGKNVANVLNMQKDLFRETTATLNDVTRNMNKLANERSITTVSMEDFTTSWDDVFPEMDRITAVKLHKIILTGLDTAYSSHTGGPIYEPSICITDEIRFASLQIYGKANFYGDTNESYDFTAEIKDMAVSLLLQLHKEGINKKRRNNPTFRAMRRYYVTGWRSFEFSASGDTNISVEALVNGYLLKNLPGRILEHLNQVFDDAYELTNEKGYKADSLLNIKEDSEKGELNKEPENSIGSDRASQSDAAAEDLESNDDKENKDVLSDSKHYDIGENEEIFKDQYSDNAEIQKTEETNMDSSIIAKSTEDLQEIDEANTSENNEEVNVPPEEATSKIDPSSSEVLDENKISSEEIKDHSDASQNKTVLITTDMSLEKESVGKTHLSDNEVRFNAR